MNYTDKELLAIAEILKQNCQTHRCMDCPFSINSEDDGEYLDCKISLEPQYWILEE